MANNFTNLRRLLIALIIVCVAGINVLNAQAQEDVCPEIEVLDDGTVVFTFPGPAGGDGGYPLSGIGTGAGFPASTIYTGSGSFNGDNTVFTFEPNQPFPTNLSGTMVMDFTGTGFIVCDYVDGILPLTLVSFTGYTTERNTNMLEWVTASESNTAWILLERSSDAVNWGLVERLPAQGWSSELHQYSAEDMNPFLVTYYRLRIVDLDGAEYFSNVIALERNTVSGVTVTPVPAREEVQMIYEATEDGEINVSVVDVIGRQVVSETMQITEGLNTKTIDIRNLAVGLYYLTVDNGEDTHTQRIIKQ